MIALAMAMALTAATEPTPLAQCASLAEQASALRQEGWEESPLGYGEMTGGLALALFVGPGGTWTLLTIDGRGIACVEAVGGAWRMVPPPGDPA